MIFLWSASHCASTADRRRSVLLETRFYSAPFFSQVSSDVLVAFIGVHYPCGSLNSKRATCSI
jgi:hypothetical protein